MRCQYRINSLINKKKPKSLLIHSIIHINTSTTQMINPYAIEKKTLQYLDKLSAHIFTLQKQLSTYMFQKYQQTQINVPKEFKDECWRILYGDPFRKQFECKICGEVFDDGRKLGGHNSKKHKKLKSVKFLNNNDANLNMMGQEERQQNVANNLLLPMIKKQQPKSILMHRSSRYRIQHYASQHLIPMCVRNQIN